MPTVHVTPVRRGEPTLQLALAGTGYTEVLVGTPDAAALATAVTRATAAP